MPKKTVKKPAKKAARRFRIFHSLSIPQLLLLTFLLLSLVGSMALAMNPTNILSRASTVSRIGDSGPTYPVSWHTGTVSLTADDFGIIANNKYYRARGPVAVHSDPGDSNRTTLEMIWQENKQEMRLFMYFQSDGREWWMNEMRTYGGNAPEQWIYYTGGQHFKSYLGLPYTGNFAALADSNQRSTGQVYFKNLKIRAFMQFHSPNPSVSPRPSTSPYPSPSYSPYPTAWPSPSVYPSPTSSPRPTSSPYPSYSPWPSGTPYPSYSPWPSASASASPGQVNRAPRITSAGFLVARSGRNFSTVVRGVDANQNDSLYMSFTDLPGFLRQGACQTGVQNNQRFVQCGLEGLPVAGLYQFNAVLFDGYTTVKKPIRLFVYGGFSLTR